MSGQAADSPRTVGGGHWCIDRNDSATLNHVEVMGSHIGMALSPDVFRVIAEQLAMPREKPRSATPPARNLRLVHPRAQGC